MDSPATAESGVSRCIVGLGNPGAQYDGTRHNIGFALMDALARSAGLDIRRAECLSLTAELSVGRTKVLLVKPQTYMNKSGLAVKALLDRYQIGADRLIVAYDDMDLPLGRLRVRGRGSAGGHNGVGSILGQTSTPEFARLRLGIGRPPAGADTIKYVLGRFSDDDQVVADGLIGFAAEAARQLCERDVLEVMNEFNRNDAALPA